MAIVILTAPRGTRGRGRYGGSGSGYGGDIISRVLSDLNRAARPAADNHDGTSTSPQDLRFQENSARGFDRDRLDGAIEHLGHLANSDQRPSRDRVLARDMYDLRGCVPRQFV
jgi:hypothetical protein